MTVSLANWERIAEAGEAIAVVAQFDRCGLCAFEVVGIEARRDLRDLLVHLDLDFGRERHGGIDIALAVLHRLIHLGWVKVGSRAVV